MLPFKRRAVKTPRRRRSRVRMLVRPFLTAILLVGCPAVAGAWLWTSPRFAVQEIDVRGALRVPEPWVTERLEPLRGRNLLGLDLALASEALAEHPWADGFEVTKELPNRLVVTVRERRPEVVLERADGRYFADAEGRAIVAVAPQETGLPRVFDSGAGPDTVPVAIGVERELARVRPDWTDGPLNIEVISKDDVRLELAALPFSLRLRPGDVENKIRRLETVLPHLRATHGELGAVDLRTAGRIIVEPAGQPAKVR